MATSLEKIFTTSCHGGTESGTNFDDKQSVSEHDNARIKRITIWNHNSSYVSGLSVYYNYQGGLAFEHGGKLGTPSEIQLGDDEYITALEGDFGGGALSRFMLTTSKGNIYGPFGTANAGSRVVWDISSFVQDSTIKGQFGVLCFAGSSDSNYIYSLSATFVNCTKNLNHIPSAIIKYEQQAPANTSALADLKALSQFARNLMSPIVTLVVGPSKTEFFVYERVISRIQFFAAALDGRFSEASQKKIVMPGDDPASIAALIEFLYTRHYTYPYTSEDTSPNLQAPKADHAEGVYHIGVYVAGDKYDCEELSKAAMVGIVNAMGELKGIECIRLWRDVYLNGLSIDHLKDFPNLRAQTVEKLKTVYAEHGEEMATIVKEIPELGNDFLKLLLDYVKV